MKQRSPEDATGTFIIGAFSLNNELRVNILTNVLPELPSSDHARRFVPFRTRAVMTETYSYGLGRVIYYVHGERTFCRVVDGRYGD